MTLTPPDTWSCPTCMCSNVETNLSWTCLVSGLLNFEYPSVLLFWFLCMTLIAQSHFIAPYQRGEHCLSLLVFTSHATIFQSNMWRHRCAGRLKQKWRALLLSFPVRTPGIQVENSSSVSRACRKRRLKGRRCIFQSYTCMWRYRCAGGLKTKLYLRSGSLRHRHFARDQPFYTVIPTHRPFSRLLRHAWDMEDVFLT